MVKEEEVTKGDSNNNTVLVDGNNDNVVEPKQEKEENVVKSTLLVSGTMTFADLKMLEQEDDKDSPTTGTNDVAVTKEEEVVVVEPVKEDGLVAEEEKKMGREEDEATTTPFDAMDAPVENAAPVMNINNVVEEEKKEGEDVVLTPFTTTSSKEEEDEEKKDTIKEELAAAAAEEEETFHENNQHTKDNDEHDDRALHLFNQNSNNTLHDSFSDEYDPKKQNPLSPSINVAIELQKDSLHFTEPTASEHSSFSELHKEKEEATTTTPEVAPLPSGFQQTYALLVKNLLYRIRTPLPTFFEICGSSLLMLLLVAGYQLSEVKVRREGMYSEWNLDLPGPWLNLIERATGMDGKKNDAGSGGGGIKLENGRREREVWESEYERIFGEEEVDVLDLDLEDERTTAQKRRVLRAQFRGLQTVGEEDNDEEEEEEEGNGQPFGGFVPEGGDGMLGLINDARAQFDKFLKSPIPIPTFTQYITLSNTLSSSITNDDEVTKIFSDSNYGRKFGNLLTLGTLHLTPETNPISQDFVNYLEAYHQSSALDELKIRVHGDQEEALKFIDENLEERTWALVDFGTTGLSSSSSSDDTDNTLINDFNYTIRMNYTTLPNTNSIVDYVSVGLNDNYQRYYLSGYLTLQRTLNEFAFQRLEDLREEEGVVLGLEREECKRPTAGGLGGWSMPMPTPAYSQNAFFQVVGFLLGLTFAMSLLYPTSRLIKSIVEEKETRMKETLAILGVKEWAHWLAWITSSVIVFFIITVLMTSILSSAVLKYSSTVYLFIYFGLFCASTIGFSFFVASFFSRAKLAAIVGPMALFVTLLPRWIFFGTNRYETAPSKMIASLLPCTAFAFGADIIADYEYAEQGIQSYNANEGEYSFNTTLSFLFFDTFLYLGLAWYLEQVLPRQYGVRRKWYFLCMPSYWFGARGVFRCFRRCFGVKGGGSSSDDDDAKGDIESDLSDGFDKEEKGDEEEIKDSKRDSRNFQVVPGAVPRVQIRNLVKKYNNKKGIPPAVNNLSLDMYESQITCLLGHNGAGKTTTISVLTGLFPPTSGDCVIYNNSITKHLAYARRSMGICPQHNVLFENLTVREHLVLFHRIKGVNPTRETITECANDVGLGKFIDTAAGALSGGNKRKLSVAIALCGDPKFLLLDEPTSGMDPYSRRATWEMLRTKRAGRVTLLTTHFMDEAELLADRVAVMKQGKLQCCGSALFLKERFGLGYNMAVVIDENTDNLQQPNQDVSEGVVVEALSLDKATATKEDIWEKGETLEAPSKSEICVAHPVSALSIDNAHAMSQTDQITNFFVHYVPGTVLVRKSARELTYRFPQGAEYQFPELFDALEEHKNLLGVGGYGVTNTTLEEVFLQLAEEGTDDLELDVTRQSSDTTSIDKNMTDSFISTTDTSVTDSKVLDEETGSACLGSKPHESDVFSDEHVEKSSEPTKPESNDLQLLPMSDQELTYMRWTSQIALLYKKRFTIAKRDLKGFFFQIILPVILVGCVLLILLLEINPSGSSITLDMDLYKKSPSGSQANTQVLLGGGAALGGSKTAKDTLANEFQGLEDLTQYHPHAKFSERSDAATSKEMTQYMFDTLNENGHDARYGSFVLDDVIDMSIDVNWDEIRNSVVLQNIVDWLENDSNFDYRDIPIDELFGILSMIDISIEDLLEFLNMDDEATTSNIVDLLELLGVPNPSDLDRITVTGVFDLINVDTISVDDIADFFNLADDTTANLEEIFNSIETVVNDINVTVSDGLDEISAATSLTTEEIVELFNITITNIDEITGISELTGISVSELTEIFEETITDPDIDLSSPFDITNDDIIDFFNERTNLTAEDVLDFLNVPPDTLDELESLDPDNITVSDVVRVFNFTIVSIDDVTGLSDLTGLSTEEVVDFFNLTLTNGDDISNDDIADFLSERTNLKAEDVLDFLNISSDILDELESLDPDNIAVSDVVRVFNFTIESIDDVTGLSDLTGLSTVEVVDFFNLTLTNANDFDPSSLLDITGDDVVNFFDQLNITTDQVVELFNLSLQTVDDAFGISDIIGVSNEEIVDFFNTTISNADFSVLRNLTLDGIIESLNNADLTVDSIVDFFNATDLARDRIEEFLDWANLQVDEQGIIDFTNLSNIGLWDIIDFFFPKGDKKYRFSINSGASILHNASSPHAVAVFNQAYMEYMYKTCSADPSSRLVSMNHPLPLTTQQGLEVRTTLSIVASLFILIPYCYIPAAFVVFLVKERVNKSKHLQLVSGVETSSYWIATYLWDMSLFLILTLLIMCVFMMFGTESAQVFVGNATSFFCTMSLTFGYGLSAIPYAYLWSRSFSNHSTAQISIMGIFFFTGFVAVNGYFILTTIEQTKAVAKGLEPLFLTWPPYVVGDGLVKMSINFFERVILGKNKSAFDWDVCGRNLALLYGLSVPYYGLVLVLEYSNDSGSGGIFGRALRSVRGSWDRFILNRHGVRKTPEGQLLLDDGLDDPSGESAEDEDVANERAYVSANKEDLKSSAAVLLDNLWKVYPPSTGILGSMLKGLRNIFCFCWRFCSRRNQVDSGSKGSSVPKRAVRGLSTAIKNGETFGLLGVNGAGKTTTLGVLTGDINPTAGDAYVAGCDITGVTPGGVGQARKNIGFCPQVDPLLDLMTARETLAMFGRLRGIPKEHLDDAVNKLLDALTLTPHADKVSQSYSGGNKRKLSLGIALIGNPKVLFIDESSSGMDPGARRKIWDLIAEVSKNRSVILTTHSMEEAEALCTRLAVMISGKMRCLGSVQHLKSTFLDGYTVDLQCSRDASPETVDNTARYVIETAIPNATLAEQHGRFLRFDVPSMSKSANNSVGLGSTFRALQAMKDDAEFRVDSYSISQCSLEQVFISLVKADEERCEENLE